MVASTSNESYSVLAYGELLWDLLPGGKVLGGAPANFANRLNAFGKSVGLISRLGNDELGKLAQEQIRKLGLNTSLLQIDEVHPTGTVGVTLTKDGNPSFTIHPDVAYDYIELTDALLLKARSSSVIYFGTLIQRSKISRKSLYDLLDSTPNALHFLDINLRKDCYTLETIENSLRRADVLKLNRDEIGKLGKMLNLPSSDILAFCDSIFKSYPVKTTLITLGESGVLCASKDSAPTYVPGCQVQVADTIGAGDAFSAGFIIKYLEKKPLKECLEFGNSIAAVSATKQGGMGVIEQNEVEQFRAINQKRSILKELQKYA
jgi:fructokinase